MLILLPARSEAEITVGGRKFINRPWLNEDIYCLRHCNVLHSCLYCVCVCVFGLSSASIGTMVIYIELLLIRSTDIGWKLTINFKFWKLSLSLFLASSLSLKIAAHFSCRAAPHVVCAIKSVAGFAVNGCSSHDFSALGDYFRCLSIVPLAALLLLLLLLSCLLLLLLHGPRQNADKCNGRAPISGDSSDFVDYIAASTAAVAGAVAAAGWLTFWQAVETIETWTGVGGDVQGGGLSACVRA